MQAFNVYLNKKRIDTIFYTDSTNVEKVEIKKLLIEHDGYEPNIVITKARKNKSAYKKLII